MDPRRVLRFICGGWRDLALVKCYEAAQGIWYSAINDAEPLRKVTLRARNAPQLVAMMYIIHDCTINDSVPSISCV
jgi:hypothetical protein